MRHKPNLIKVAVEAAGGRSLVASQLGVDRWTVSNWQRGHRVPVQYVRALCDMGERIITPEQLLAYIEENAAAKEAA